MWLPRPGDVLYLRAGRRGGCRGGAYAFFLTAYAPPCRLQHNCLVEWIASWMFQERTAPCFVERCLLLVSGPSQKEAVEKGHPPVDHPCYSMI